jgi:hypothetical protein
MYHLPLEAFACLEVLPLGHDESVLLSVVVQALLCNFCVQVPPLLSFPAKPLMAVSGNSRLLSAGFHTEARRRHRVADGGLCDRTTSEMRGLSPKIISGILDEARMRKHTHIRIQYQI